MKYTRIIIVTAFIISSLILISCNKTDPGYKSEIEGYRMSLNEEFADPSVSPLLPEDRANFEGLEFFPIDQDYKVLAKLKYTPDSEPFEMATNTERKPLYRKYAEAHFELKGENFVLSIYQNQDLIKNPEYEDYLFLPFKDLTNGKESYGGGRFLDLKLVEGNTMFIDFNKAYNPLCAYNHKYSCPIPPFENHLDVEIRAGVKAFGNH